MSRAGWLPPAVLALVVAGFAAADAVRVDQEEPFPHEEHAGLFPVCTGCHAGVETSDRQDLYPDAAGCADCHDGDELDRVEWTGPERRASNLTFEHAGHADDVRGADEEITCAGCHGEEGAAERMVVRSAEAESCLDCHAHEADSHLAAADCSSCHTPLAATGFALDRIEALPTPEFHRGEDFLEAGHARRAEQDLVTCTTCHTQERCTSCHVDGSRIGEIARMPSAPDDMRLPPFEADYFEPDSHGTPDWLQRHGRDLDPESCASCHTQQDCTTCHVTETPDEVGTLASREEASAPGASLERAPPGSHDSPFFAEEHGNPASASDATCTTCHTEASCTSCHDASMRPGFHPPNFTARHSSGAYGQQLECSNCHDTGAFCRDCHEQQGLGTAGRMESGFHDGVRLWRLRHGQAARQALETCATCHEQRDCLQCHSTLGAFQVSPHGPGFDARRAYDRNPQICFACHTSDPIRGGGP